MLTSGQKPAPSLGRNERFETAERAAHHQQRSQHAARRAGAERNRPDDRLDEQDAHRSCAPARCPAAARRWCHNRRRAPAGKSAADADDQAADGRPPHPVDVAGASKSIFRGVNGHGQQSRQHARKQAGDERSPRRPSGPMKMGCGGNGEQRAHADDVAAQRAGRGAGERHRDQAARLPFEQQQFDRQQDRRRAERRMSRTCQRPRRRPAAFCVRRR